ncbi:hypothetical protein CLG85_019440 [Yangia mangrovi]|uniref:DUF721 domain-containing protein n=2 Tax=Alloyangia mangrovi TaxID=1779329 RepID=A0ABT2KS97_9RHOB|nr:hypothetical protein [Alloyangia mangrovi]MCT4372367.1 hypothetical protein [Alloyangia mangrovi]
MHVERVEFDDFQPIGAAGARRDAALDPWIEGPHPGAVSLVARNGQLHVALSAGPTEPRRALVAAIRQLLRMADFRGGAHRLTFSRTLPLAGSTGRAGAPTRQERGP